jgi:hypothetical protein
MAVVAAAVLVAVGMAAAAVEQGRGEVEGLLLLCWAGLLMLGLRHVGAAGRGQGFLVWRMPSDAGVVLTQSCTTSVCCLLHRGPWLRLAQQVPVGGCVCCGGRRVLSLFLGCLSCMPFMFVALSAGRSLPKGHSCLHVSTSVPGNLGL